MTTKYYDISCAIDRFDGFPKAQQYLQNIVNNRAPVPAAFNQTDYEQAKQIAKEEEAEQAKVC